MYSYSNGQQNEQLTVEQIKQKIRSNPNGQHYVWKQGWSDWVWWAQVPEFAALIPYLQQQQPPQQQSPAPQQNQAKSKPKPRTKRMVLIGLAGAVGLIALAIGILGTWGDQISFPDLRTREQKAMDAQRVKNANREGQEPIVMIEKKKAKKVKAEIAIVDGLRCLDIKKHTQVVKKSHSKYALMPLHGSGLSWSDTHREGRWIHSICTELTMCDEHLKDAFYSAKSKACLGNCYNKYCEFVGSSGHYKCDNGHSSCIGRCEDRYGDYGHFMSYDYEAEDAREIKAMNCFWEAFGIEALGVKDQSSKEQKEHLNRMDKKKEAYCEEYPEFISCKISLR